MLSSTLIALGRPRQDIARAYFMSMSPMTSTRSAQPRPGITRGRLYQLAAYMLCIALFAIVTGAAGIVRNGPRSYWLNLIVVGWADLVWVLVVVPPGTRPYSAGYYRPQSTCWEPC